MQELTWSRSHPEIPRNHPRKAYRSGSRAYVYTTKAIVFMDRDEQWLAYEYGLWDGNDPKRTRYFKTRAAAKRCVERWMAARVRNAARSAKKRAEGYIPPRIRCNKCEKVKAMKDDYLCEKCRYG